MKTNEINSRRKFLGAVALGATASTISLLTNPMYAKLPEFSEAAVGEADRWISSGIKGKHRIVYDGSMPHNGFPVLWNFAFYLTNNQTGASDSDITAMTVFRHKAIPFAYSSKLWKKYNLGEFFGINDNYTNKGATHNTLYEPRDKDLPLPGVDGIKRLQERGALFCVCDLATKVYSGKIAAKMGLDAGEVYQEWVDNILPGVKLVPSGVWALGRAQNEGCGYIFAGE